MTRTVIILGAGASQEVGLPIGAELKRVIANSLSFRMEHGMRIRGGDPELYSALRHYSITKDPERDIAPYLKAARLICNAMPQARSIDNFIDAHVGDKRVEACGKLAIVKAILQAERESKLYVDNTRAVGHLDHESIESTWFNVLLQIITEGCRASQLEARLSSVTFIVFNYDRCVEHYLFHALRNYYNLSEETTAGLVRGIKIYHPYGSVGWLSWQQADCIDFGSEATPDHLVKLAGQVKTFTEGTDPSASEIAGIRYALAKAERLIFLGFAFHPLNLELLWGGDSKSIKARDVHCFATALNISAHNSERIAVDLATQAGLRRDNIRVRNDLTCNGLLQEYSRSLSVQH